MSKTHRFIKKDCDTFQKKILITIDDENLIKADVSLNEHIKECPDCQNFIQSLHLIQSQWQIPPFENLKPRSRILKNIIHMMELKQKLKLERNTTVWDQLCQIFEYKIPVYQAASSLLVLMFLFIFLFSQFSLPGDTAYPMDQSISMKDLSTSDLYALDSLHLLKQERGINATEDSVLIGFLVSSL
jgi:hypothetical protein